jgi:uncharacterized repeat protein (TIGR03803 family)
VDEPICSSFAFLQQQRKVELAQATALCAQDSDFSMGGYMKESFSVKGLGRLTITAIANSALLVATIPPAHGQTEKLLYSFANNPDGANPRYATPVLDTKGNLYGTTVNGGAYVDGRVFEVTPSGTETILHSFANNDIDGINPYAGLVLYKGNFYGTTVGGGGTGSVAGIVFDMTPSGTETILHVFAGSPDGAFPWGGVVFDKSGNLYGTTFSGGSNNLGTVFKVTP